MALDKTICILICIVTATCVNLDQLIIRVAMAKLLNNVCLAIILMTVGIVRCAAQGTGSKSRVTTDDMAIVSMVLSKGLFENGCPDGIV